MKNAERNINIADFAASDLAALVFATSQETLREIRDCAYESDFDNAHRLSKQQMIAAVHVRNGSASVQHRAMIDAAAAQIFAGWSSDEAIMELVEYGRGILARGRDEANEIIEHNAQRSIASFGMRRG